MVLITAKASDAVEYLGLRRTEDFGFRRGGSASANEAAVQEVVDERTHSVAANSDAN